jgi:hypothetical protein
MADQKLADILLYRNQLESNQTCRSTVSVADAVVLESGPRTFMVTCDGRTYNLKAASTVDRDKWTKAIRQAADRARLASADSQYSNQQID